MSGTSTPPRILAIAGSDSSGGAGVQADIKTITMLGGYAMTAITAVTAQDTSRVHAIEVLSAEMIGAQIDACVHDIGVDAVKIGMLGSPGIADAVAGRLQALSVPVVFDPVMIATSGAVLADAATVAAFERLMCLATVTTPNLAELGALGGAQAMTRRGISWLAKGGDAHGDTIEDSLHRPGEPARVWRSARIGSDASHGTGCTLSSAIATFLALGLDLTAAVARARQFVRLALHDAPPLGRGASPLGHHAVRLDLTGEPRLNQVTLPARDYAASVAFYRALGLAQCVDSPENGYARFVAPGGATLSVHCDGSEAGGAALYFECLDLDAQIARLRAGGIAVADPVEQSWLWREAWLIDPAGNRLCLYQADVNRRHPPWSLPRER